MKVHDEAHYCLFHDRDYLKGDNYEKHKDAVAERIAYLVWDRIKSKDIRDVLKIARLTNSLSDVDWLVDVRVRYRKFNNNGLYEAGQDRSI